jgi:hypothetical protein
MAHEHLGASTQNPFIHPPIQPAFFHTEDTPTRVDSNPELERYVLVQSAAPVPSEECEELGRTAIEVTVLWGANVLHVAHLSPPRAFSIGHGDGAAVDFIVPAELAPFSRTEIVAMRDGLPRVVAPAGSELQVRNGSPSIAADDGRGGSSVALSEGAVADVSFGALSFRISSVTAGKRMPRELGGDTRGLGSSFVATFAAVATILGTLAYYTPALGLTLDEDLERERLHALLAILQASADREEKQTPGDGQAQKIEGGGTPGTAAKGPEGKMGRPEKPSVQKRFAISGGGELTLSRPQLIAEVKEFGTIGILNQFNSRAVPQALWGADVPNGPDAEDAWGELYGEEIGESGGAGGLGLIGLGEGGGGRGEGVGIGGIGTCGTNCGMGPGKWGIGPGGGTADSVGRTAGPGHVTKVPTVRPGKLELSGRIPAEVIQRTVRQNYGRFRSCYDMGLRTNPNLTGRVTARFVIGRDGAVSNAMNGGGDLPDAAVTSCVISAFYGLSFPAPDGGIVTVTYPIMFVPG